MMVGGFIQINKAMKMTLIILELGYWLEYLGLIVDLKILLMVG